MEKVTQMMPEEVARRLEGGESAILLSAEKWDRLARVLESCARSEILLVAGLNCALCRAMLDSHGSCDSCPLHGCGPGSTYWTAKTAIRDFRLHGGTRQEAIGAARVMRDELLSLAALAEIEEEGD